MSQGGWCRAREMLASCDARRKFSQLPLGMDLEALQSSRLAAFVGEDVDMASSGLSSSVGPNHRGHWVLSRRCKMNRVLYPQIDRAETSCSCQSPRVHGCRGVAMIVHLLSEFQPKVSPVLPAPAVGRRSRQRRKLSTGRGGRFGLVDGCPFNESARNLLHHDATHPAARG